MITLVVCICSPSTVTMANGSGSLRRSLLMSESAATTVGGKKVVGGVRLVVDSVVRRVEIGRLGW